MAASKCCGLGGWLGPIRCDHVGIGGSGAEHGTTMRSFVSHFVAIFLVGASGGSLPWLALRQRAEEAKGKSLASILVPTLTFTGAFALGVVVFAALTGADTQAEWGPPILLAGLGTGGVAVVVLRWLILRRRVARAGWAVLGSSLGLFVGFFFGYGFGPPADFCLGFATAGAVGGTLQWLALRRRVERAGWWVVASSVGSAIGAGVGIAAWVVLAALAISSGLISLAYENALGNTMFGISHYDLLANVSLLAMYGAVGGAVGGAITGPTLIRLLRQPLLGPISEKAALSTT